MPDAPRIIDRIKRAWNAGELAKAGRLIGEFVRDSPQSPLARYMQGLYFRDTARWSDAERSFRRAIALAPDYAEAHYELGCVLLVTGRFRDGWEEYGWRWKMATHSGTSVAFRQPLWGGEAINGRRVLLYDEQGFGDSIQFVRFAGALRERGATVIYGGAEELRPLIEAMPSVDAVLRQGQSIPDHDFRIPAMSMPRVLGIEVDTIPREPPYLQAAAPRSAWWRDRLARAERIKAGLVWAGRPTHPNDRNRSVPLARLGALLDCPGVAWFGLQTGAAAKDIEARGLADVVDDLSPLLTDFGETAAAIAHLDLVITVDTAVAHLTGALGKPVWTMLTHAPDWRWLLERTDSPWYPSMRLYRQPRPGDWIAVVDALRRDIEALANGGRAAQAGRS